MGPTRRVSVGRSPLVRKQSQITTFFTPGKTPNHNPNPNPNPSPNLNPSEEKKKTPLLIPSSVSDRKMPQSEAAIGKRVRVFWPLDKTWYEGRIKSFDVSSGKHVVQYDDAEEELLDLGSEKIEWVEEEEAPRSFRRLRRSSTSSAVSMELDNEEIGGDGSSEDEDWAKETGKDAVDDDSEEMELEVEEEEEVKPKKSRSGRGTSSSVWSGKRKKIEVGKLGCSKKFRFDGDEGGEKSASVTPMSKTPTNKSRSFATGNAESKYVSSSRINC